MLRTLDRRLCHDSVIHSDYVVTCGAGHAFASHQRPCRCNYLFTATMNQLHNNELEQTAHTVYVLQLTAFERVGCIWRAA